VNTNSDFGVLTLADGLVFNPGDELKVELHQKILGSWLVKVDVPRTKLNLISDEIIEVEMKIDDFDHSDWIRCEIENPYEELGLNIKTTFIGDSISMTNSDNYGAGYNLIKAGITTVVFRLFKDTELIETVTSHVKVKASLLQDATELTAEQKEAAKKETIPMRDEEVVKALGSVVEEGPPIVELNSDEKIPVTISTKVLFDPEMGDLGTARAAKLSDEGQIKVRIIEKHVEVKSLGHLGVWLFRVEKQGETGKVFTVIVEPEQTEAESSDSPAEE